MISRSAVALAIALLTPAIARAADKCVVPDRMSTGQKLPCVRESSPMLDQPTLTIEQVAKGPEFDAANPSGSRFGVLHANRYGHLLFPSALCVPARPGHRRRSFSAGSWTAPARSTTGPDRRSRWTM